MSESEAYTVLQVSQGATPEEIKAAFRRLVRQYHPDLNPNDPASSEQFRNICEAYHLLSQSSLGDHPSPSSEKLSEKDYYVRGVEKALEKDYQGAERCYSRAIGLNANFLEAYLKRCEARYKLGDDRGVLKDCYHILRHRRSAQAFYYQGRSRMRLGYPQSAIDAYTQALRLEEDAQAYYHRGLAYHELDDSQAIADIQTAARLFQAQGDRSGYLLAQATLKKLNPQWNVSIAHAAADVSTMLVESVRGLIWLANPVGGMLRLSRIEKPVAVGILYALMASFCFMSGASLSLQNFSWLSLGTLSVIPFASLAVTSAIACFVFRRGSLAGALFLAGTAILPLGVFTLFWAILPVSFAVILFVFAGCYTVLLLYGGFTQIFDFSEAQAAFLVPVALLVSGWCTYLTLTLSR
ncbi:MAG: DnaJ domain-containing protein [Cyanophyceae cyanobacterium]